MIAELAISQSEYASAVLNILEDFAVEKARLQDAQSAVLNILDDAELEKHRLEDTEHAVLNILEDLASEKTLVEATQAEVVRSEQAVRASLHEKEVLLKEIHHRVKNNLQVISSLLHLQAHYLSDSAAREIFRESQNRVQSIALVHEKLYRSVDLSHIDFSEYVVSLVDNLFHTHNAAQRRVTREIDLGGARLAIDLAIPCGLVINELVTNSLKYAFPDGRDGVIAVMLKRLDAQLVEVSVADNGVGLPAQLDPRHTKSLGLDLVFTLAEQIGARVEIARNAGTRFQFTFAAHGTTYAAVPVTEPARPPIEETP